MGFFSHFFQCAAFLRGASSILTKSLLDAEVTVPRRREGNSFA